MLYKRFSRTRDISLLKNVRTDLVGIDLTGDADYRDRVRISRSDSGYQVGSARTRRSDTHRRLSRDTGIAVCSVTCICFVSDKNVAYILFGIFKLIVERADRRTGVAENGAYALSFEAFYHSFAYRHFHIAMTSTDNLGF